MFNLVPCQICKRESLNILYSHLILNVQIQRWEVDVAFSCIYLRMIESYFCQISVFIQIRCYNLSNHHSVSKLLVQAHRSVWSDAKFEKLETGKLGNYQRFFPLSLWLVPLDNSSGSALRGICSGDELLNISPLKMSGNVEYATTIDTDLMIFSLFSLVFITIEFTWSYRTRCLQYVYSLDFLNIWLESLSVKHTGRFCIFACLPRSQVPDWETPSESGRLGITMYAFSTQTQTSSRTSTLKCDSYAFCGRVVKLS